MCSNDNVVQQTRSKVTAPQRELELELELRAAEVTRSAGCQRGTRN